MLIFEKSNAGLLETPHRFKTDISSLNLNINLLRKSSTLLPNVSELEIVRHYTRLSKKNFSIDTNLYPLGSCTMKYNPKVAMELSSLTEFLNLHPLASDHSRQGLLEILYNLQEELKYITGFSAVSLSPMAGAQGEFAGISIIKKYHQENNECYRDEIIIPDSAHGTNPATAKICGYKVREVKTLKETGNIDLVALRKIISNRTAGIMLTNPSTLGVLDENILLISKMIHDCGGLLYYDGANLNALMGRVSPFKMGFDIMHMNLHKTFATPHGGGGPGAGPIAVTRKLASFLPIPIVEKDIKRGVSYNLSSYKGKSIGRLSCFFGNIGVLLKAYIYIKTLGESGIFRASSIATLNSNYLMKKLKLAGFTIPYEARRATHEFVISLKKEKELYGVTALDLSKALLDYGIHAPTMYFPLIVDECLLIEPTETEKKSDLDYFVSAMIDIKRNFKVNLDVVRNAPIKLKYSRFDEQRAVKDLKVVWK
jgi:glycine dehydrogenase subunit 2